jgi:hypothetical protein
MTRIDSMSFYACALASCVIAACSGEAAMHMPLPAGAAGAATAPVTPAPMSGMQLPSAPTAPAGPAAGSGTPSPSMPTPSMPTPSMPAPAAGMKVSIIVPKVAAGQEGTKCIQIKLPNAAPASVVQLHNKLSPASHHFIITALSDPAATEKPIEDCRPFRGALAGAPLAISQKHDDLVSLPEGVGYRLNAQQVMHLELHYLNTSDQTLDVTGEAELVTAPPGAALQDGSVLLVGTTDINVPAHAMQKSAQKFMALPQGMDGVKFFAITGHTHRLGTNVTVSSASGPNAPLAPLYAPDHFDWEAPEMKQLTPHVSIPSGGGFMLQCSWNNTSDSPVSFGESATAEMCFFWGYYYPRKPVASIVLDNADPSAIKRMQ